MDDLRKQGDSVGARVNVIASGVPVGLGEPVFDRIDADIAHAMMSINAVKGIEIGAGFTSVAQKVANIAMKFHHRVFSVIMRVEHWVVFLRVRIY